jgi:hypothetical protein
MKVPDMVCRIVIVDERPWSWQRMFGFALMLAGLLIATYGGYRAGVETECICGGICIDMRPPIPDVLGCCDLAMQQSVDLDRCEMDGTALLEGLGLNAREPTLAFEPGSPTYVWVHLMDAEEEW